MEKIKTIIVDDELSGRQSLEKIVVGFSSAFEVIGIAKNAEEGVQMIRDLRPDLVFADIEMPYKSGLDMLKEALQQCSFQIVLTTAHEQYAIKAINQFDVIGYLLKPVDLDEFYKVEKRIVEKLTRGQQQTVNPLQTIPFSTHAKLFIPKLGGKEAIDPSDIIYCKASGPYTEIHLFTGEVKTVSKPLKATETILNNQLGFFRVHDSYLINCKYICELRNEGEGGVVILNKKTEVDISRRKKHDFLSYLESRGLFFS